MANITLREFGPKLPILSPYSLPDQLAQEAINVDIRSGDLESFKYPSQTSSLGSVVPKTLWKMGSTLVYFDDGDENDVVNAELDETKDMIFWTDGTMPKMADTDNLTGNKVTSYERLGVTAPTLALTLGTHVDNGNTTTEVQEYVAYVYTYVATNINGDEWESAPSPATVVETIYVGEGINLSTIPDPTDSDLTYVAKRIYRLSSGTAGAEYQFLVEIDDLTTSYQDWDSTNESLETVEADILATTIWDAPPDDMVGLTQAHNGMLVGYVGKLLYVSVNNVPYAFPEEYTLAFDDDIVGVGCFNEYIVVFTNKSIYTVTGSDAENLLPARLPHHQVCLNHRGITTTSSGCYFPSPDGLCFTNGSNVEVMTSKIISKEDWLALNPDTLIGAVYDDRFYGIFSGTASGLMFDWNLGGMVSLDLSSQISKIYDLFLDNVDDQLYMLTTNSGGDAGYIYKFAGAATYSNYTWTSKYFIDKEDYSCIKVLADCSGSKSTTVTFYADDMTHAQTGQSITIDSTTVNTMIRLQAFPYRNIKYIKAIGNAKIIAIMIATSPKELI